MAEQNKELLCTAFKSTKKLVSGDLISVALKVREIAIHGHAPGVLVFDDQTGQQIDLDLHGSAAQLIARLGGKQSERKSEEQVEVKGAAQAGRGRTGRPKLGVVAREVTLLPRHWQWLSRQPGGASVALRKLVEEARRAGADKETVRQSQEAAYRFMSAMAGNEAGFEEATRALFARNLEDFEESTSLWPPDVRKFTWQLAGPAMS